jgi:A/G-specific adenine glycosylase
MSSSGIFSPEKARAFFAPRLLEWHRTQGRHHLPWQNSRDPYRIWVSEIMLQQTQVETVMGYFDRFMARFPTVEALAQAPIEAVMALWSGLGYYSRARHLHAAAQHVQAVFGGVFPSDVTLLQTLPGVGRSTASAIAAFAFSKREPILDGNVRRVVCRVFGVFGHPGQKAHMDSLWALVQTLMPDSEAMPAYTQAQMDLGALLCRRSRPNCPACPLQSLCVAFRQGLVAELPQRRVRKKSPLRFARMFILVREAGQGHEVWLEPRPHKGIWGGLLSLPEQALPSEEGEAPPAPATEESLYDWAQQTLGLTLSAAQPISPIEHTFSHFRLHIEPWLLTVSHAAKGGPVRCAEPGEGQWVLLDSLENTGLPAPVRRLLKEAQRAVMTPQEGLFGFGVGATVSNS